jgi:hypothetical protein
MIQSLNILRKDVRHLWVDLCVYVGLLIASSVMIPMAWDGGDAANIPLRVSVALLKILIPIMWLVMIARLIHDESLVGDQQFWISRPYRWTSLLAAKLVFIGLCLVLPFSLSQWAILLQAGFHPLHTIPIQGLSLLQMGLIVWLTLTVVASVTSTLQRMFMSVLAVLFFWAAALTALSVPSGPRMGLPFAGWTFGIVLGGLLVAILVYQYASRNTFRSRMALAGTALLLVALFAIFMEARLEPLANALVRHHYPVSADASLKLVFDPTAKPSRSPETLDNRIGKLEMVVLPVSIQGLDPNARLGNQNVLYTIDAPGYHYASPWRPAFTEEDNLVIFIPQAVLDNVHGSNLHMHFVEAAQRLRPGTPQSVTAAANFNIPEEGRCHLQENLPGNNITCRFPFHIAELMMIRAEVTSGLCSHSYPTQPGITVLAALPPLVGPDPTVERTLHLGGAVCPGTLLTVTAYQAAENFHLELDVPSISLDRYLVR